jgi:cytoskeletal protein CcmA (bactofilin family)
MVEQYAAVIGRGMVIKGSVYSKQDMVLNGELEGQLNLENCRLTIGPTGKVVANATAREVDVHGQLTGNVDATDKICIRTGGSLLGDIRAAGIIIEDGAHFKGGVDIIAKGGVDIVTQSPRTKSAGEA